MRECNWVLLPGKYLNKDEANRLLSVARHRAEQGVARGKKVVIRDYLVIHLAMSTGLRVMEIAALKCGDLFLDEKVCSVLVRNGKGNKKRLVFFTGCQYPFF